MAAIKACSGKWCDSVIEDHASAFRTGCRFFLGGCESFGLGNDLFHFRIDEIGIDTLCDHDLHHGLHHDLQSQDVALEIRNVSIRLLHFFCLTYLCCHTFILIATYITTVVYFSLVVDVRTDVLYNRVKYFTWSRVMSELKDVITAYRKLPFGDRVVFYSTVSNDVDVREETVQDFLIETRMGESLSCIYCKGDHVVRNGKRKDGTQRFLCRDCGKSFIPGSNTITSGTRKRMSTWVKYLKCMLDKKTLKESSEECGISMPTAFSWRHKILDALREVTDKVYLDGTVEADETFFNVSYKGNHKNSKTFTMPRKAHKRGNDTHAKGLSSEKVCVPCAVDASGISYARPAKLGKPSSSCISTEIQRINAYHRTLKEFIGRFHGVSTKHLGNYIVWNNLIANNRRKSEETLGQLFARMLSAGISVRNKDISSRPPLPSLEM